ncbi:MAG: hypothetical protein EA370_12120 [Wenzhouxiangella sp.]|nr:MAG: hypothetical protein EA370_12120 [Wenzhouxiangella sp.]
MPGYRRYFQDNDVVFITLVTDQRNPWLSGHRDKRHFLSCLRETKRRQAFRHFAHVVLDDHFHWLVQALEGESVSELVRELKLTVFHRRRALGWPCQGLWQSRFYDHIIRDEHDFCRHMDYIHYNPVRHGYVVLARQWRWSSFHTWVARGRYSHCWGSREPDGPGEAGEPG